MFRTVRAVSTPAPWIGGKFHLAERLVALIEQIPHKSYCEPFLGMGGIFFRRTRIPSVEVVNDISEDLIRFFRVAQHHFPELVRTLRFSLSSRSEFRRFWQIPPDSLTEIQRAARFYYLQRNGYRGKPGSQTFHVDRASSSRFNIRQLKKLLLRIHDRLAGVVIECLNYPDFISLYDSTETLFYLDPPYFGSESDYGADLFRREDFARLADLLSRIQGKFLLSINDTPEIRSIFAAFHQLPIETTYTIGGNKKAAELVISNSCDALSPPQAALKL